MTLNELNCLPDSQAESKFLECCHSQWWAKKMIEARPFESKENLINTAEHVWSKALEVDILEAFSGHAQIGDLSKKNDGKAHELTQKEQGQVTQTSSLILEQLKKLNDSYFEKFGFIYIVFATGKPAEKMLEILQARISNTREQELSNGSAEQNKITKLRIDNLVEELL